MADKRPGDWLVRLMLICFALLVGLIIFWFVKEPEMKQAEKFEVEFGRLADDPDQRSTALAVDVRLQALCDAYVDAEIRAVLVRQTITPGTTPGSEAERMVMQADAVERVADEEADLAFDRFVSARELAQASGRTPRLQGCEAAK